MATCDLKPRCVKFADGGVERCMTCAFMGDPTENVILLTYEGSKLVLDKVGAFTWDLIPGAGIERRGGNVVVVTNLLLKQSQCGPGDEYLLDAAPKEIAFQGYIFFAEYLSLAELQARA